MPKPAPPVICLKTAHEFAFSPSGNQVAFIGGRDVTVLDVRTQKPLFAVRPIANPSHIDFSPDGGRVVVKGTSGRTIILDAKTGRLLCDFRNQKEGEGDSALFTACGRFVASVSWNGLFSVRDCTTSELVFSRSHSGCQLTALSTTADRSAFTYSIGRCPRTDTEPTPCTIAHQRWPTQTSAADELPKEWSAIWGARMSPSGRFLAIVCLTKPKTLEIYSIAQSRTVARCNWSGGPGCTIAWSGNEKTLITNGDDCFRVYDLPKLTVLHELPVQYPCFAQFSASGKFLALGSWKQGFIMPTDYLAEFESSRKKGSNRR